MNCRNGLQAFKNPASFTLLPLKKNVGFNETLQTRIILIFKQVSTTAQSQSFQRLHLNCYIKTTVGTACEKDLSKLLR